MIPRGARWKSTFGEIKGSAESLSQFVQLEICATCGTVTGIARVVWSRETEMRTATVVDAAGSRGVALRLTLGIEHSDVHRRELALDFDTIQFSARLVVHVKRAGINGMLTTLLLGHWALANDNILTWCPSLSRSEHLPEL